MPPNPAATCTTPESLVDHENPTGYVRVSATNLKHVMTEPRRRNPLQTIDLNRPTPTNQLIKGTAEGKSSSAPLLAKRKSIGRLADHDERFADQVKDLVNQGKRPAECQGSENPAKKSKAMAVDPEVSQDGWKYPNDRSGVVRIASKVSLVAISEEISTPLELLRWLEATGKLSPKALNLFSKCPEVNSLSLALSFGSKVNELGLREAGAFPFHRCTQPFFHGYSNLQALDLTCVPIDDDQLRFIIRLSKLQALGLSRTRVSGKGIRYLGKHSVFAATLQCLKLCYLESFRDDDLVGLRAFKSLKELDLFGCNKVSFRGLIDFLPDDMGLETLRIPSKISTQLGSRHADYVRIRQQNAVYIDDPELVATLTSDEVQMQLRIHQTQYPHIFLNLECDCLRKKLTGILKERAKEEHIWHRSQ